MGAHRIIWFTAAGSTALLALAGARTWMPIGAAVAMVLMTAGFGAAMGVVFKDDLPHIAHPVLGAAVLFATPTLYPGLAESVGEVTALAGGAVLLAGAPGVVDLERRWLRGRLLPSQAELAVMADPDDALRRQWMESTHLLQAASTRAELRLVLRLREQILDDLAQRSGGVLPDYVWAPPEHGEHGWFARGA